jgi:SAM-dependent methyltransferase
MLPVESADLAVYDRRALGPEQELGSWRSGEYVAAWAGDDVLAELLTLPMQITTAIVADAGVPVQHVLDLGSGPGSYLGTLLGDFPLARGTWVDSSGPMEAVARERLAGFGDRVSYVPGDVAQLEALGLGRADVVITARMLHDLPRVSQQRFYRAAYELVEPGGFFFNLDHFGAPSGWEEVYRSIRDRFTGRRRQRIAPHRDHPLTEVGEHLEWIEEAGFEAPDVPWRTLLTGLLAARKPG